METTNHPAPQSLPKISEERFQLFDYLLEGCQIIGSDWKYIYLNRAAEIHNNRPNSELLGNYYQDMWPGIENTDVYQIIKQALEDGVSSKIENKFFYPNGSHGWFDLNIQPIPEGVFILSLDITKRKWTEFALRESEEKYRLVTDSSDDWIYWKTPEGDMKYLSPACERITGYSPLEFDNDAELNYKIVLDADKDKVRDHTHIPQQIDKAHNLEFRIKTKSGEIRWISHSCSPIYSPDGEFLGRRGTNRDRKRIQV